MTLSVSLIIDVCHSSWQLSDVKGKHDTRNSVLVGSQYTQARTTAVELMR